LEKLLLIAAAKSEISELFPPKPGNFPIADTENSKFRGNLRPI
jgi:hypothetical protein